MATTPFHPPRAITAIACAAMTLAGLGIASAQTPGTVLLNVRSAYLKDTDGNAFGEGDKKLVVFVADLNGDGIAHPTTDSFAPGSDDFVIGSLGTTSDAGGTAVLGGINLFANAPLFPNGPTVDTGDSFAMFWYPELSQSDFLGVQVDGWASLMPGETAYGAYNAINTTEDGSWTIPNPPSAEDFVVFTTEIPGAGTVDPLALQAQFHTDKVIPEPSTALLTLLGGAFLLLRRRRS